MLAMVFSAMQRISVKRRGNQNGFQCVISVNRYHYVGTDSGAFFNVVVQYLVR
jgi:hypothetical protein